MRQTTFDLDVLRSFLTGMELGSFAKAADRLNRSTSAISAQLRKLEDQAGTVIFRKAGRGLVLTEAGETLLGYARRLIELNDEAATAVRGVDLVGWVRLGVQEDFGEFLLPDVLARFARAHPKVRIEARVARNAELLDRVTAGRLDLVLAWGDGTDAPHGTRIADLAMCWIGPLDGWPLQPDLSGEPLPLISFEAPCLFRSSGTAALDRAGIPWRLSVSSANLGGLWAATAAGLGLTVRTALGLPRTVRALAPGEAGLLPLPNLSLALYQADAEPAPTAARLAQILRQAVTDAEAALPALEAVA